MPGLRAGVRERGGRSLRFDGDAPRDTNDIQVMVPVAGLPFELVIP